jgi:Amt family ammonium transporter
VDDNQTNREILQSQLCSWSMRADIAADAEQAIGMLNAAHGAGDPYRFAILDMHMPQTDGMQLANSIKNDPRTRDVILISLSSISDHIKKEQMNDHGFAACLTKPVMPSQLYDTIVSSLAANESDRAPVADPASSGDRLDGVRVLLAEDNEVNRMVATELLRLIGCQCTVAVNGQEAVDAAMSSSFDVILMDCQMPILDGFEATRKIRQIESAAGENQHRRIVALTANAIKGDRELCLASGMDEYLTKPIEPKDLLRTIRQMLPGDRLAQVDAATPTAPAPEIMGTAPIIPVAETGAVPNSVVQPPPVDLPSLQRRCVNNRKLAAKALRMFDSGIDRDVAALTQGITDRNAKAVASAAHKIKGAASNVSAEFVRETAAELEKLGREDAMDQTQNALDDLTRQIASFRGYLDTAMKELVVPEPSGDSKQK